jgi:hypothetical protein
MKLLNMRLAHLQRRYIHTKLQGTTSCDSIVEMEGRAQAHAHKACSPVLACRLVFGWVQAVKTQDEASLDNATSQRRNKTCLRRHRKSVCRSGCQRFTILLQVELWYVNSSVRRFTAGSSGFVSLFQSGTHTAESSSSTTSSHHFQANYAVNF